MLDTSATEAASNLPIPELQLNPEMLFTALLVVVAGWGLNKMSNYIIEKEIRHRGGDEHVTKTSKRISGYLIYSLTFVVLLGIFGVPLTALGTVVGLIGLGLSFALKDMIANFVSGIILMVNRPFKIGDQITVSGESGTVRDIMIRATEIKTYDGREVIVPNSDLYNGMVINNTAYDERRFEVVAGVGYDDNIPKAKELALDAMEEAESVEISPEPQVLVDELGDSSVNLKFRAWTKPSKSNIVKASSEVTELVKEKYDEEGIDIPYPIRTVFMEN